MSSFAVPAQDVPIFSPQVEPSTTSTLRNYARRASRALVGDTPNLIQSQEEKFAQLRQRVPSEFIVNRVSGGFFEGRVKNIDKSLQNKTFSVGRFKDEDHATTMCIAQAPPVWETASLCSICNGTFAVLRPRHHCRNCGCSVCSECSGRTWPSRCLPATFGCKGDVRICDCCSILSEKFKESIQLGNISDCVSYALTGNVNLTCPLSPGREYPLHVAARAGRLDIMKTLCASPFYASLYYNLGGKTMAYATITQGMRQKGLTVMALAGMNKDIEMVRWLHCEKRMPIAIIDDVRVLQELLEKMFREQNSESPSFNPVQATVAWAETVVIDNNDNSDPPVFQAELVE